MPALMTSVLSNAVGECPRDIPEGPRTVSPTLDAGRSAGMSRRCQVRQRAAEYAGAPATLANGSSFPWEGQVRDARIGHTPDTAAQMSCRAAGRGGALTRTRFQITAR